MVNRDYHFMNVYVPNAVASHMTRFPYTALFYWQYTVFQKSDAKIQITITTAHLIRINYPINTFNNRLSGTNIANFNKIHHMVSEQQLFYKMELKNRIFQYGIYRLIYLLQQVL